MAHWLFIDRAVQMTAERLAISIGAAGAALCDACASGAVRWRDWDPVPITRPGLGLTREVWKQAHIDRDAVVIGGGESYELVQISRDDLEFWLSQQPTPKASSAGTDPAKPATNRRTKYTDEQILKAVDDCLETLGGGKRVVEKALLPAVLDRLPGCPRQPIREALARRQQPQRGAPKKSPD